MTFYNIVSQIYATGGQRLPCINLEDKDYPGRSC